MKKLISALGAGAVMIFLLSSCRGIETVELNSRLIIESIGIDSDAEMYDITIEGLDCISADTGKSDLPAQKLTKCYFYRCATIGEAINKLRMQTGLIPLFSQTRVILIGRKTAETKLNEVLNFFMREYSTRIDILIAAAENNAKDIISADFGDGISAGRHLEEAINSYKYTGTSVYSPLYRIINASINKTDSPYCPLIGLADNPFKKAKQIKLSGTIAFPENKSSLTLNDAQTLALMLINGDLENGFITVDHRQGKCTLKIVNYSSKTKTEVINGRAKINFYADIECDIPEFQTDSFSEMTKEDSLIIAQEASKLITENTASTLGYAFFGNDCDIFSFGRRINLKNSDFYKENIEKNKAFSEKVDCRTEVRVSIRRMGKIVIKNEKNNRSAEKH